MSDPFENRKVRVLAACFPFMFALVLLLVKILFPARYADLVAEDSAVEWVQAICCAAAAGMAGALCAGFFRARRPVLGALYAFAALSLFFVCMEELSWGQRLIGFHTPESFAGRNTQNELTVHNLRGPQKILNKVYILAGLYGTFAWIPALALKERGRKSARFLAPEAFLSPYFLFVLVLYAYFDRLHAILVYRFGLEIFRIGEFFVWRDQEPAEMLMAMGVLFFFWRSRAAFLGEREAAGVPAGGSTAP